MTKHPISSRAWKRSWQREFVKLTAVLAEMASLVVFGGLTFGLSKILEVPLNDATWERTRPILSHITLAAFVVVVASQLVNIVRIYIANSGKQTSPKG